MCHNFAGNDEFRDINTVMFPAKHQLVISVGACNVTGHEMELSAVGPEVDFLCPGERVESTGSVCIYISCTHC